MCEQASWAPEADSITKDELKILADLVRDFSKRHACQVAEEASWKVKFKAIKDEINKGLTDEVRAILDGPRLTKKAPWLLVSGWLNNFLCEHILAKPFYFLKIRDSDEPEPSKMDEVVRQAFEDLKEGESCGLKLKHFL